MIELSNLSFSFDERKVLEDISLKFSENEVVAIMGASGCGKTTLARCLNGLLVPDSGEVAVDGLSTREAANLREIRRRVGMGFQNPENQLVSVTVEREIAFGLENLGVDTERMHKIVDEMLDIFSLKELRLQPPHLLSGGEMQRLALAAIFALEPKYLVLDECTSFLDPQTRSRVLREILRLQESRCRSGRDFAVIHITHFPEEALSFPRLIVLDQHRVLFDDRPSQVFENVERLFDAGVKIPPEFEVTHYLRKTSNNRISLNPSDFLPIE